MNLLISVDTVLSHIVEYISLKAREHTNIMPLTYQTTHDNCLLKNGLSFISINMLVLMNIRRHNK